MNDILDLDRDLQDNVENITMKIKNHERNMINNSKSRKKGQ